MRLVQVRDLLAGQGWFDTVQHRLNTPYGLPMHWSRLVDAPLALLTLISERFALIAWPLLVLAMLLWLLARLADRLGGRLAVGAVLVLTLLCPELYATFTPGNIDHHGLQLVLMFAALFGVIQQRPRLTAALVALSLGVGLETLPYAVLAIGFSLADRDRAQKFGVALAGTALLLLLATTADPYRTVPVCDTYSLFYAVLLMVGGLGVAAISLLPRHRLAALAGLVLALTVLAALLNPACFAGPYGGLDARMKTLFLARINEAHPVWEFFRLSPSQTVGGYVYAVVALALCFVAPPGRARNVIIAFSVVALAVATLQYRATPFALVFALPGLAAALVRLTERQVVRAVWLVVALLLANGAVFTLATSLIEGQNRMASRAQAFAQQVSCGDEQAMRMLKTLPRGRVAGFVDQGPAILANTPHSAVAGPYHRDAAGILDSYEIFAGNNPRAVLDRRGIAYVMTCRAAPDWGFYEAQGGLIAKLAQGAVPDWLVLVGRTEDVEVYRVKASP
jgi:MFS family permease